MTVENENYRNDYNGNDSTTSFPVTFYFLADEHLRVILTDAAGVSVDQVLTTDYTVTGAGAESGGTVEMVVAPATGEQLTILRDVPLTQLYDYIENDNFPAESHETALDKLTMIVQQQEEELDRVFTIEPAYAGTDIETVPLADSFLVWDDDGDELTNLLFSDLDDTVEISKLYYLSDIILQTFESGGTVGLKVLNDDGGEGLAFYNGSTLTPSNVYIASLAESALMHIHGMSDDLIFHSILIGDPDGGVKLFYDHTLILETVDGGVEITGDLDVSGSITGTIDFSTVSLEVGTLITDQIQVVAGKDAITMVEDGGVTLYFNELDTFVTTVTGARLTSNTLVTALELYSSASGPEVALQVDNPTHDFRISMWDGAAAYEDILKSYRGGAVELYYNDVKAFATSADGVYIYDTSGGVPNIYFRDDAGVELSKIISSSALMRLQMYNGASYENGVVINLNGSVELYYDNAKEFETMSNGVIVPGGALDVGEDHTARGIIRVYGSDSPSAAGGEIYLYVAADYDTTIALFQIQADEDDLLIGPNTDQDALKYIGNTNQWNFSSGVVNLGEAGVKGGILQIGGEPTVSDQGGEIILYVADDHDTTIISYNIQALQDDLLIGPDTDEDALKYDGGDGGWKFTSAIVEIGVDDTAYGLLRIFGHTTGETQGGAVVVFTSADYDTTIQYYGVTAIEDDLQIGPNTDPDALLYNGGKDWWESTVEFVHMTENVNMGPPDTDGSWRMTVSGTDLLIQRRESSAWVTKTTVPA